MISKLTNVESAYEIPDVLWDKIVPLLPPPKRKKKKKKKAGRLRMNDRKAMSAIFYVLRTGCQWMHYHVVLVLPVQYMTDFKNGGERLVYYSNVCGLMVYRYMIKRLGLIGNGKLWMMVLLQRRLLGEKGTGANPTDRAKSGTKRSLL